MRTAHAPSLRAAAELLLLGGNPLELLDLEGIERQVAHEVLQKALDIEADRRKGLYRALEVVVQNGVAKAFGAKKRS